MKKNFLIPPKTEPLIPQIEISGDRQVIVEGCKYILEYEPETVKLDVGKFNLRITGTDLTLISLADASVMIEGGVLGVELHC